MHCQLSPSVSIIADNCLAKAATSRGKSQTTLRFAHSAPALTEACKTSAIPNTNSKPSAEQPVATRHTSAPTENPDSAAAADRATRRSPRTSDKSAATEITSPIRKKGRTDSSWSSSASQDSDDWIPNRGSTASCRDNPSAAAPLYQQAASPQRSSAEDGDTVTFNTFAVGRRFHPVVKVVAGQTAALKAEPSNARDPNALLVVSHSESPEGEQCLGYLPATISAALAPLLASGAISVLLTVLEPPKTPKASLPIKLQARHPACSLC